MSLGNDYRMDNMYELTRDPEDWDDPIHPMDVQPRLITCRHCGKTGLVWRQVNGAWRLHKGQEIHSCSEHKGR